MRDVAILIKIAKHQENIANAMKRFECKTEKDMLKDQMFIDLGSFYLSQIGELAKNLSDESKDNLTFINTSTLRTLRNVISHTYEATDKSLLAAYIMNCQKKNARHEVLNQIEVCKTSRLPETKKQRSDQRKR